MRVFGNGHVPCFEHLLVVQGPLRFRKFPYLSTAQKTLQDDFKFRVEHPIICLSHPWEAHEHPDFLGLQLASVVCFRNSNLPGMDHCWYFSHYCSVLLLSSDDHGSKAMFGHDETYTLAIRDLSSACEIEEAVASNKIISVYEEDAGAVQQVKIRDLKLVQTPVAKRAWMWAEQQWSLARSSPSRYMTIRDEDGGLHGKAPTMATVATLDPGELQDLGISHHEDLEAILRFQRRIFADKSKNLKLLAVAELPVSEMAALSEALPKYQSLQRLHVIDSNLPKEGWKGFAAALKAPSLRGSLEQLVLCGSGGSGGGDTTALLLAEPLGTLTRLRDLDLSRTSLGNVGALALVPMLKVSRSLRILRLGWNALGDVGAAGLAQALQREGSAVEELILRQNWIGDAGAGHLAAAMSGSASLASLDLAHNCFGAAGRAALRRALAEVLHRGDRDWDFRPEELQAEAAKNDLCSVLAVCQTLS